MRSGRNGFARLAALGLALAGGLAGCSTNAATGKSIFAIMSRDEEIALGAQAAPQFTEEFGGKVSDARLNDYVAGIGRNLAAQTESYNPGLPWEFTLLDSPVVNAFALPGGKVFVSRGLAERLTSEAQLAGVIGHEIGHVTAQHGNQRISSQTAFNLGLTVAAVVVSTSDDKRVRDYGALGVPALSIGGNLVLLSYGRDQELEADRLGVRYMTKLGYDPRGQMEVMEVLASLSKGNSQPAFLSTHPDPQARVQQIRRMLENEYKHTQQNPEFQQFAERYRRDFLTPLSKLPPPKQPVETGSADGLGPASSLASGFTPGWCAHCSAMAMGPTR